MKRLFVKPIVQIIIAEENDILTTSIFGEDNAVGWGTVWGINSKSGEGEFSNEN